VLSFLFKPLLILCQRHYGSGPGSAGRPHAHVALVLIDYLQLDRHADAEAGPAVELISDTFLCAMTFYAFRRNARN
jgi:hypothetical protein